MKWLRRGLMVLVVLGVLLASALWWAQRAAEQRALRTMQVTVQPVAYVDDDSARLRGKYLYESRGCADCHGLDGGGRTLVNDGKGTHLAGPNITQGNSRVASYQPVDWVRSIRHGLAADGRVLRVMPSEDYNQLTDSDLAAVVAWARSFAPRKGNEQATLQFPLPAVVAYGLGAIPDAADRIDHKLQAPPPVPEGVTVEAWRSVAAISSGFNGVP